MYAADYTSPTPSQLTTAISDMGTAYTNAAGRTNPDFLNLYSGQSDCVFPTKNLTKKLIEVIGALGGETLAPGLYKWTTGVSAASSFTCHGGSTDSESDKSGSPCPLPLLLLSSVLRDR